MLTVGVIGPKKLVNDVLHFFCALSNRRTTVHFSYVPSVLELELCMGWKYTWCFVAMKFGLIFIYVHLLKALCYTEAVKSCLLPFLSNFFCTPVTRPTSISPEGGRLTEVGLYSLTNQCYFSLIESLKFQLSNADFVVLVSVSFVWGYLTCSNSSWVGIIDTQKLKLSIAPGYARTPPVGARHW